MQLSAASPHLLDDLAQSKADIVGYSRTAPGRDHGS